MELKFKIVTPERTVFSATIQQVSLPTAVGQITVLPNHESLIGIIEPGAICIKKEDGEECLLAVSEGFLEIDNNLVRVFTDTAQHAAELNEEAILLAKKEAEEALKNRRSRGQIAFAEAETRLKRELAKLKVIQRRRNKKEV